MKKSTIITIASFVFLIISSIIAYILRYFFNETSKTIMCLIIGVAILIFSGIFAIFFRKDLRINCLCFIFNAIALGFFIRSWYLYRDFDNSILVMILVSFACLLYIWIFYFLIKIKFIERHFKLFFWTFLIVSIGLYIVIMANTITTYVSTFGFYMIVEMAFLFALCTRSDDNISLFKKIVVSTYSVIIIAIIIAVLMITEGDDIGIDGFDLDLDIPVDSPNKKKNNIQ